MAYFFAEKETDEKAKVVLIYNVTPPEEVIKNAEVKGQIIIEAERPVPGNPQRGKSQRPYINPKTKEVWLEQVDRPLTPEERMEQLDERLQSIENKIDQLINNS